MQRTPENTARTVTSQLQTSTTTATTTMMIFVSAWAAWLLPLLLLLLSTVVPQVVLAARDTNTYMSFKNPNFAYDHYWEDAPYVLQDLSSFQALYVVYHNCAWSAKYGDYSSSSNNDDNKNNNNKNNNNNNNNNNHRYLPEGENKDWGECGQKGGMGDGRWYRGMGECYGSNVAYSLYGILADEEVGNNPCNKQTFINSFYTTDGLQSFADASQGTVDDSSVSQSCTENGDSSYTLGCSSTGKFQIDEFLGGGCIGVYYTSTLNTLDDLNEALTENMQCQVIYKSDGSLDVATQLLSNSMACNIHGNNKYFCPDPHGMLEAYQYNFVRAQESRSYKVAVVPKTRYFFGVVMLLVGGALMALSVQNWTKAQSIKRAMTPDFASPDGVMT